MLPRGMRPPLVAAAAAGALAIVNELLRAGADVNVADAHGWTALIAATRHDRIPVMRRLLASGAYPDAQTNAGDAAMHFAAARDNVPAAAVLDRAGALVDIANTAGITPLFVACNKGYMRVVTELLRQGANPFLPNNRGETPIMMAAVRSAEQALDAYIDDNFDFEFAEEEAAGDPQAGSAEVDDAPVVKFIQKMMVDAIVAGASDIHFEPYEKSYRVRFRVDGELREVASPPLAIREKVSARIKVLSRLDISEKRAPQDGRLKLAVSKSRSIDFRVSTLPTLFGEKICMRILDPSAAMIGIDALGYEVEQKQALLEAIGRPHGMVLVTGPTGSGKTVSLYTCLGLLNRPETNISTIEDPVEVNLAGVNQVNVNDKVGLSFAVALRSFLRQDPDVIMVGEIRDFETAEIAVKAAQTGHLVLASLHTNDAPATLARLINMGIAPFNIASSVNLITAQRLARRLCSCKRPADIPVEALLEAGCTEEDLEGGWQAYAPVGCELCSGQGYKGRVGIYQVMPLTEDMRRIIMKGGDAIDVAERARAEGVLDLRQSGLRKVRQGMTSLEEVMACTNE